MSGTINDMALRICRACRKMYVEDDQMYVDINRCPNCGADLSANEPSEIGGSLDDVLPC